MTLCCLKSTKCTSLFQSSTARHQIYMNTHINTHIHSNVCEELPSFIESISSQIKCASYSTNYSWVVECFQVSGCKSFLSSDDWFSTWARASESDQFLCIIQRWGSFDLGHLLLALIICSGDESHLFSLGAGAEYSIQKVLKHRLRVHYKTFLACRNLKRGLQVC